MKKEGQLHARVGLQLVAHQGAMAAGEEAMGLYLFCLLYSRSNELDGFVPRDVAERGWSGSKRTLRHRLDELCSERVAYLIRVEHPVHGPGYEIVKYDVFNETKSEIKARRDASAEKKRIQRRRVSPGTEVGTDPVCPPDVPVSDSVSVNVLRLREEGTGTGPAPERPANDAPIPPDEVSGIIVAPDDSAPATVPLTRKQEYQAAYIRGISRGKGGPFAWPEGAFQEGALHQAIQTFGRKFDGSAIRGSNLIGWIEAAALDFAGDVTRRDEVRFYSSYYPKGFVKWLNEQEKTEESRRVG